MNVKCRIADQCCYAACRCDHCFSALRQTNHWRSGIIGRNYKVEKLKSSNVKLLPFAAQKQKLSATERSSLLEVIMLEIRPLPQSVCEDISDTGLIKPNHNFTSFFFKL